jgi:tetratricopeptide (TPR) repeat protein
MKWVNLFLIFVFLGASRLVAQEKTFEREYTYKASELDSKISCRAIAINQLRSSLLNEIGVYVQNEQILKSTDVNGKFSQDFAEKIATISAGITKLQVLDEKWNGETFWMKAAITIDKKNLEESLKEVLADRQKVKDLEEIRQKLDEATREINKLKETTAKNQVNTQNLQSKKYNMEINTLVSTDFFCKANVKTDLQDNEGAIADYTRAIELDPTYAKAYNNRGVAKKRLQDYRGAIVDYTKAIELDSKLSEAYNNRGIAKQRLKDFMGAIIDYTKTIELDPKNAYAYNNRGLAKIDLGHKNDGCLDLSKAGELGDTDAYEMIKKYCN